MTSRDATESGLRCPRCSCCTVEASQRGLCGACNIGEDCESCLTLRAVPAEAEEARHG